jgi:hypothetical protein
MDDLVGQLRARTVTVKSIAFFRGTSVAHMAWQKYVASLFVLLFVLLLGGGAAADGYLVAIGAEADTENNHAYSAFSELGIGESTWISGGLATSRAGSPSSGFDAVYVDAQIDHLFDPVGVRVSLGYWGDSDVLDSVDVRSSIYLKNERISLSADYERRDYDLIVELPLLMQERTLSFSAHGIGFSGRAHPGKRVSVYLGGMWYDYPENVTVDPGVRDLRSLSLSRLMLAHGLLDRKAHAGVEVDLGQRSVDFRYANWHGIGNQGSIDSFGVGFLTPLGASSDIEVRLSRDDSDTFGDATVLSVFLYFFGA